MTAATTSSYPVQRSPDCCWSGDDGLRTTALKLLQSSGFAALRRLRCEVTEAVVIVHGIVPSYYLKQMAQTAILRLDGIRGVRNLVEVLQSDRSRPLFFADAAPSYEAPDEDAVQTGIVPTSYDDGPVGWATAGGPCHEAD